MEDQEKSDYQPIEEELKNTPPSRTQVGDYTIAVVNEGMVLQLFDGSITACNASAERVLGLTTEQIQEWIAQQPQLLPFGQPPSENLPQEVVKYHSSDEGEPSLGNFPQLRLQKTPASTFVCQQLTQLICEDGSPLSAENHPSVVAWNTGKPCCNFVLGWYKPNGDLVWLLMNSQPLFLPNTVVPYAVVLTFIDITEVKQVNHKTNRLVEMTAVDRNITERQQRHDSWQDALSILAFHLENSPLAVIEWDHEFRVSRWSQTAERIFGWQAEEVMGKRCHEWQFVSTEDKETVQDVIRRLFRGSEKQLICRNRNYTKDGSVVYCEWYNSALSDESGQLVSVLSLVLDVTSRTRAETEKEQMLMRSRQYASQLHGLTEAALTIHSTLSIEEVTRIITEQARTIIGAHQSVTSLIDSHGWAHSISSISLSDKYAAWRNYQEKPDESGIYTYVRQINRPIRMTQAELVAHPRWQGFGKEADKHPPMRGWLAAPLKGRDGKNIGLIQLSDKYEGEFTQEDEAILVQLAQMAAIAIENTNLYTAEQQARTLAEQANCIKDQFLAVLSHELRSPLNPILGWSKLLQSRKFDPSKTALALETIERNAKLQAQLIEDLLDVSRIFQGKLTLNVETVDLVSTIIAALETIRLAAQVKSIDLKLSILDFGAEGNAKFLVMGDSNRLQQVLWNLLSNAVKFTPPGGRIEVQSSIISSQWSLVSCQEKQLISNRYAQIKITDTGQGINPDFLPHVFDYFRQADSATTRKFGGLGLGLAIVRQIVELHGGTVMAESLGNEKGATFIVNLPLLHAKATVKESQQETQVDSEFTNLQGFKILVVDDDDDSRDFISFVLAEEGAEVIAVPSAVQALQAITESKPDVLLSDIGMPDMDGYMLISQVRTWKPEQGGQIPAIALTAYAGEYNQQQALSVGFQMHITKPTEPSELVAAVTRLVSH
ncbi:MAG: PAS domain S-box protein [Desmonostoc vinosum HA7617-LM4]|jgi:PAS domain S-box-containing protein|nr:PAS domain S-box protein [Desmonostoc vinosum HA7617-LM4]